MKKRYVIPYTLLIGAGVLTAIFLFRSISLKSQLDNKESVQDSLQSKINDYKAIFQVDSMLIKGNYNAALESYNENLKTIQDGQYILPLRIAVAEKMKSLNTGGSMLPSGFLEGADSLANAASSTLGIREGDSLRFALEKAKVQLNSLRKQLKQKLFGEYLTFKSKKGNRLHYVGQVKNGRAHGTGIAILDSGSRYEGEWEDNFRSGEGNFYWADGEHYEGSYKNDVRNGLGTYYWPNKEKYVGQWKNDKRNGKGTFYGSDGKVVAKGIWKEDKLVVEDKKGD